MERLLHNLGSEGWLGWGRESPLSPHIRARPRYTITIAARPARHSPRTRLIARCSLASCKKRGIRPSLFLSGPLALF